MYINFHSAVGTAIMLLPIPVDDKIVLATASHALVDTLGEASLGDKWLWEEIPLIALILVVGIFTGNAFSVIAGIIFGNAFDILDMRYENGHWVKKDIIHKQGRFGKWLYPTVLINLTKKQTLILNILSVLIVVLIMVLK
mgnify:CR=1 FL=1